MDATNLRTVLGWSTVINYVLLIWWVLIAIFAHDWLCALCSKLFRVTPAQVEKVNFYGVTIYKLTIIVFNLVPYLALLLAAKA